MIHKILELLDKRVAQAEKDELEFSITSSGEHYYRGKLYGTTSVRAAIHELIRKDPGYNILEESEEHKNKRAIIDVLNILIAMDAKFTYDLRSDDLKLARRIETLKKKVVEE